MSPSYCNTSAQPCKMRNVLFSASFMNYKNAKSNRSTILSNTPTNLHLICLQDHRLGRENEMQWFTDPDNNSALR
jgi:hypothetical protein